MSVVRQRSGQAGLVMVGLLVLTALISLVWTPHDPTAVDPRHGWVDALHSASHPLGTDRLGRDELSMLMAGARQTLFGALACTLLAAVLGVALALSTVLAPRRIGSALALVVDVFVAFPIILLAIVLTAVYGSSRWTAIVAIGFALGVHIGRVARAELARILTSDYVVSAAVSGASTARIARRHLLPNIAPTLIVQLSLALALATLSEAALSYLGFGGSSTTPSWGAMLQQQQQYITARPLLVIWPGLAVTVAVLGFNLLGDGVRDAADPRLRVARGA